ncbi:MAG TPA: hypothetical protein VGS21_05600, partial [Acidimicrobiales bacterium]|nr:hypothetical protein [Acidimicrobiales bacterium]
VHYDLAWNPTRHEQREGRVDRFGQERDIVRAVTIYGEDNRIDQIVLDVLIRKFMAIRDATGVSVPVPDAADGVVQALVEGLILSRGDAQQLTFDLGHDENRVRLHKEWDSAAERERVSRTKYAQDAIHPEEAVREAEATRSALGTRHEVEHLTVEALRALGAPVTPSTKVPGWSVSTTVLPLGLRDALPTGHAEPLVFHRDLPAPRHHAVLARTDPSVEAVARYVLDTALDPILGTRVAARAGVTRTRSVSGRTTLLLVRIRLQLDLPGPTELRQLVTEDARFLAFAGAPDNPTWLEHEVVTRLLDAKPDGNVAPEHAASLLEATSEASAVWADHLDAFADGLAEELLDAHRRVRAGAGAARRGLSVTAQKPVDLLGAYVFLPMAVS